MIKNINKIMPEGEFRLLQPFDFNSMYELGNKKNGKGTYKHLFESQGVDHISIDLNGKDGALPLDLSKPIDMPSRDIVTNYGTSEHIKDQEPVFRNIHNLSHYRMIHMVPRHNNSPTHGLWHVDTEFYEELAKLNNYHIEIIYSVNKVPRQNLCCSYKKLNQSPFVWEDNLYELLQWQPRGTGVVKW